VCEIELVFQYATSITSLIVVWNSMELFQCIFQKNILVKNLDSQNFKYYSYEY